MESQNLEFIPEASWNPAGKIAWIPFHCNWEGGGGGGKIKSQMLKVATCESDVTHRRASFGFPSVEKRGQIFNQEFSWNFWTFCS